MSDPNTITIADLPPELQAELDQLTQDIQDLDQRRQAQQAIIQAQRLRLQHLFHQMPVPPPFD
jgi:Tfp pilus assembly protein PilN